MAKINLEFDTVEKTLRVTMDGEVMENVDHVSLYKMYYYEEEGGESPKFEIRVQKSEKDKDNKLITQTTVMASEKPKIERKSYGSLIEEAIARQYPNGI